MWENFFKQIPLAMNLSRRVILRSLTTNYFHFNYLNGLTSVITRSFETSQYVLSLKKYNMDPGKIVKRDGTVIRKKTVEEKLITVVHNSKEKVMTKTEALQLAEHKNLYLVQIKKPQPKSMDFYELTKDPGKVTDQFKKKNMNIKRYIFKVGIEDNDVSIKVKVLIDALNKYKIASYTVLANRNGPIKAVELSNKIQKLITASGVNFKITSSKGSDENKTLIIEINEEDSSCVNNVKESEKNPVKEPHIEDGNKS